MKAKLCLLTLVALTLLASACAPAASAAPAMVAPAESAMSAPAAPPALAPQGGITSTNSSSQDAAVKRIVIKNATLSIVVKDPALSITAISEMAESMGGFVVSSNVSTAQGKDGVTYPQAAITIRVPAGQMTLVLTRIKAQAADASTGVLDEQVSGSDVTKEYTDLQSRLTNLQNASDQLTAIMAKGSKTEDVMSVYNQLTQVNEQIEVIKGQIKYYDEASNLSEISVTLKSVDSVKPISVAGWQPVGVARDAVQALLNTLQLLTNIVIWLALYVLPTLLVIALLITLLVLLVRAVIKAFHHSQKPQGPAAP